MSFEEVEPTISQPPTVASFSSLPEEIVENILARVSRWSYPSLSVVSKRFHSLLSSPQIYKTRSQIGAQETCVYAFSNHPINPSWFSLWTKPNTTPTKNKKSKIRFRRDSCGTCVDRAPFSHYPPMGSRVITHGSEIYVTGGSYDSPSSSIWILDCRTHTWREAPNMTAARYHPCLVLHDMKLYVMGGCSIDEHSGNWIEVFDIKTQSWTALPGPGPDEDELLNLFRENCYVAVEMFKGKLYVATGEKDCTYDANDGTWKLAREKSIFVQDIYFWVAKDDIIYGCDCKGRFMWCNSCFATGGEGSKYRWRPIEGLEKLYERCTRGVHEAGGAVIDMHYYDEKLVVMWDPCTGDKPHNKIWYAKISLKSRSSSSRRGREIWGNVECVDLLTFPGETIDFLEFYAVSV